MTPFLSFELLGVKKPTSRYPSLCSISVREESYLEVPFFSYDFCPFFLATSGQEEEAYFEVLFFSSNLKETKKSLSGCPSKPLSKPFLNFFSFSAYDANLCGQLNA